MCRRQKLFILGLSLGTLGTSDSWDPNSVETSFLLMMSEWHGQVREEKRTKQKCTQPVVKSSKTAIARTCRSDPFLLSTCCPRQDAPLPSPRDIGDRALRGVRLPCAHHLISFLSFFSLFSTLAVVVAQTWKLRSSSFLVDERQCDNKTILVFAEKKKKTFPLVVCFLLLGTKLTKAVGLKSLFQDTTGGDRSRNDIFWDG